MGISIPKIKASRPNRPRNAFDLSQRHLFTAHAGMLLPILSVDLLPHDHIEINAQDFMRTLPMETASFASMRSVYEFFYVPYKQLWSQFDQFITGMNDFSSSAIKGLQSDKCPTSIPYFNLKEFYDKVFVFHRDDSNKYKLDYDGFGYPRKEGVFRLMDLLGYSRSYDTFGTSYKPKPIDIEKKLDNHLDFNCNPFRLLAYNKIYQDFYRHSDSEAYNADTFNIDGRNGGKIDYLDLYKITELHYRNAQLDYFTNLRWSMLFSMPSDLSDHDILSLGYVDDSISSSNDNNSVYLLTENDGQATHINVSSIRAAFAVDKLLSVTMRAGKTFQDQMRAHYGVDIPDGRDGRVKYLGGFNSDFQLSDVTQTSATADTKDTDFKIDSGHLGRSISKGTSSGRGRIVYDAKEHGVLMCIYSLVPQMQYDCTRIDPMVTKKGRFDFFTPEFENLGLQPLEARYVSTFTGAFDSKVLGYQPRYSEYKTALDINHGAFSNEDSLSFCSVGRLRRWPRFPDMDPSNFKIDPGCLNSVFPVNFNGSESTDCVYGGCNFNIVKVSDMSVDGMPKI